MCVRVDKISFFLFFWAVAAELIRPATSSVKKGTPKTKFLSINLPGACIV